MRASGRADAQPPTTPEEIMAAAVMAQSATVARKHPDPTILALERAVAAVHAESARLRATEPSNASACIDPPMLVRNPAALADGAEDHQAPAPRTHPPPHDHE
jgi:hypothetical protein